MLTEPLTWLFTAWLACMGLVIGSFLNVVIARVPEGLSVVRPRSRCPRCGHQLSWYENIPVLSWLLLRGRCRGCQLPISARYPLVELLTAALFMACLWRFGWTLELVSALLLVMVLVPLTFIDADHWILPFELTVPGILAGLALSIPLGQERFMAALLGVVLGFLGFRAMEYLGWLLFKKEALGGGDKYLLALLGAFLTYRPLLVIIFLASLQGAVFGIARLLVTGRAGPQAEAHPEAAGPEGDLPLGAAPAEEPPPTMSWAFLAPGLPLWRRLLLLPGSLLLQPIPDEPEGEEGETAEWTPGVTNLPFGPWLALAGVEVLLLGPWMGTLLAPPLADVLLGPGR